MRRVACRSRSRTRCDARNARRGTSRPKACARRFAPLRLRGLDRLLASRTSGTITTIAVAALLASAWSALVAASAAGHVVERDAAARALYAAAAASVTMAIAAPALVWTIVSARRMRRAARAVPPIQPGEPAECRVCGAPLVANEGVARCGHCGADNVVDADVLRRAGAVREEAIEDLSEAVRANATSVSDTSTLAVALVVALSLFAVPLFTIATGEELAKRAGVTFGADVRWYAFECARDPHVLCLANTALNPPATCMPAQAVPPSVVVGKRVVHSDVVDAAQHNVFFGDVAVLQGATGRTLVPLDGTCVESPSSDAFSKWFAAHEKAAAEKTFVFEGGKMVETDAGPPPIDPATYCQDYVDFTFDCGIASGDDALRASTVGYCLQGLSPYNEALIACYVKVMNDEDEKRACAEYSRCAHAPAVRDAGKP